MSRELTPGAARRLLAAAAPLLGEPELGAIDTERYELGPVIGRGGMGIVYEAHDRELGRTVALKVLAGAAGLSPEARARFVREARAAARLVHPNIASVYDATPDCIAMQRVRGETLAERPPSEPRELAALVRDAALAVHYAHTQGIVHRDLKPANLMVERGERPHVYVMDFGLAKERAVDSSLSVSGSVIGTPAYMAPEQAAGRAADVGPRTDVYGLGATLYHCLAGRPPFEDGEVYPLLRRVVEEEPPPLRRIAPRVDADLATIVATCLAKEPDRRYASALALAGDLERWLSGQPIAARPASLAYRLRRYVSRRQGAIVASLAAALLAFLVALPFLVQARARRAAAEEQRDLVARVFALSEEVRQALGRARAARDSGGGHERQTFAILDAAIARCRDFLASNEAAGHAWLLLGELLHEQGRLEDSLAAFDRGASLQPGHEGLARRRGLVLAGLYRDRVPVLGEPPPPELETWRERAERDLAASLEDDARLVTPASLYARGMLSWLQGDLEGAVLELREVVELDPGFREAHLALSRLHLLLGDDVLGMRHSVIATDLMRGFGPAYAATTRVPDGSGIELVPGRRLLPLEGMRELLVDYSPLLALEPGTASAYGMRGQAQVRRALRALERGDRLAAWQSLDVAVNEYGAALVVSPAHAAALVDRGVCRAQLDRVLSESGEPAAAAEARAAAFADYDAALAADPELAVAYHDRALLHQREARLAGLALRARVAGESLAAARRDAAEALSRVGAESPWRERFEALALELE